MTERRSGLLHPMALAAIAVLVVNDHVLKARHPGWITGKLSDVAGLVFFPLLLRALVRLDLRACIAATAAGFAAVKLWQPATDAWAQLLGVLQWPWTGTFDPVAVVRDPTDLIALPALALAWLAGRMDQRADGLAAGELVVAHHREPALEHLDA